MTERALSQRRTDGDRKRKAPFLHPYFPFDPFCCFATLLQPQAARPPPAPSPPPPATARIQSLHINPAHNSHFPVWATLRFGCFNYPRRRSKREGGTGGRMKIGEIERERERQAASYRLGFLSDLGF